MTLTFGTLPSYEHATHGRGVDVVFDGVGGDTFPTSIRCLARGGRHLMIGFAGAAVLYDTSNIINYYPEDRYVSAAMQLFASIALM